MIEAFLFEWGQPVSSVSMTYQDECAIVLFDNQLSTGAYNTTFELDGHKFTIVHGDYKVPDQLFVVPRSGMYATPESITVYENNIGRMEICPLAMF